ncbi:MAG: helix-hairpin-helix domain-containing protein [Candidatus Micrarchaeales archaeon]|nr:helix-hairpin-helix domain-containing protein [Candidatus Micrarchaeales archaeon]
MEQELRLIVDQRERNEKLIGSLETRGVSINVQTIPVGDYVISDRICIERKTISDFESSIMSGRLFDQLKRMSETYKLPILILEGDHGEFRLGSNVINGTIISVYVDYGIPVMLSSGPEHTAEILASIAKREQSGNRRDPSLKGGARAYTDSQFQEFVVGNLPSIGPKLAKSLLKHFGSIKRIANASPKQLAKVEKIGEKKAEQIHRIMNQVYEGE